MPTGIDEQLRALERELWELIVRVTVLEQRLAALTWLYRTLVGAVAGAVAAKLSGLW